MRHEAADCAICSFWPAWLLRTLFMNSTLAAMAGFALTGAITPGPVNVIALRHGHQSACAAFFYVMGASLSYALIVWLMGQGGHWLLEKPQLLFWAPYLCATYLLWLAWRLASARIGNASLPSQAPPSVILPQSVLGAFAQGITIQSLNPKAWLVALSGVGMFVAPLAGQQFSLAAALFMFCAISLLACLIGVGCWAAMGHVLLRWLSTPLRQQRLNQILALILVACVLSMLA